jgi:pimeloyl-ACP methyl ester carboxylesterase
VVAHSFGVGAITLALSQGLQVERVALISGPSSVRDILQRALDGFGLGGRTAEVFWELCARKVGLRVEALHIPGMAAGLAHVPALVIHDRGDAEIPYGDAEVLAAAWPGARLLTTEELGHRRILRDDAVVAAATAFLAARTSAATDDRRRIAV